MNLAALIFIIKFIFFSTTVRAAPRRSASSRSHDESASRNGTLDTQSTEKVRQAAVCRSEGETCGAYGKSDDCCPRLELDCLHGCMNYFVLSTKQSWSQAKAACEAKGAKLAQLSPPTEVENAAKKIQDKTHYWIGGHCPDCRRPDVRVEMDWRRKDSAWPSLLEAVDGSVWNNRENALWCRRTGWCLVPNPVPKRWQRPIRQ